MIVHVFISGFVQGVGFRRFIRHNALKIGVKGWTKNTPDNRVECVFQGTKEQLEKIISICKKGPFLSEVKDVIVEKEDSSKAFDSFEIIY